MPEIEVTRSLTAGNLPDSVKNGTSTSLLVTAEKVWLQDSTLSSGPADNTGVSNVNAAWVAATAKAQTAITNGYGQAVISGQPGSYKWDTSQGSMVLPRNVQLGGGGQSGALAFSFPADTGLPGAIGLANGAVLANATSVALKNVRNAFPSSGTAVSPKTGSFTYTGVTGSGANITLTGCVGTPAMANGRMVVGGYAIMVTGGTNDRRWMIDNTVSFSGPTSSFTASATLPTANMDGMFVGGNCAVNPAGLGNFRMLYSYAGDHEMFGGQIRTGSCWAGFACMAPLGVQWPVVDSGNQLWEAGLQVGGCAWCVHYISSENGLISVTMQGQSHQGSSPWWMWKDDAGVTGAYTTLMASSTINDVWMEVLGLGIVGTANGGLLTETVFRGGGPLFTGALPAGFSTMVAPFQCDMSAVTLDNFQVTPGSLPSSIPLWIGNTAYSCRSRNDSITAPLTRAVSNTPVPVASIPTAWNFDIEGAVTALRGRFNTIAAGDVVQPYSAGAENPTYPAAYSTVRAAGTGVPIGVALTAETQQSVLIATSRLAGAVATNVVVASNPPTSPSAAISGATGPGAATYYYKVAHVLSGGGVTAASTEVSQAVNGSQGVLVSWTAATGLPHGQAITATRIYRGTTTGGQAGYFTLSGTGLSFTDTGTSLTGATTPPTTNVGCEVYTAFVRLWGAANPGKVCSISATDPVTVVIGQATTADNGATAQVIFGPVMLGNSALPSATITTAGDLLQGTSAGVAQRLGIGSTGGLLSVSGGLAAWSTPGQGLTSSGTAIGFSGTESINVVATSGSAQTLAAVATSIGNDVTLSASCTFTMPTAARGAFCYAIVRQASSGGPYTATFTGVKWPAGTIPTMSTAASAVDRYDFVSDGTNWYGMFIQAFA